MFKSHRGQSFLTQTKKGKQTTRREKSQLSGETQKDSPEHN